MGELADDMLDGTTCSICGTFFDGGKDPKHATKGDPEGNTIHSHGFPAVCWACWATLSKRERTLHQRALVRTI